MHKSILNATQPPHDRSFQGLFTKKRWVWPLANSQGSTLEGLILGNLIYFSGAIPISFTPLLRVNFSRPQAKPLSTITASVLKAALEIPAQNFPLDFSIAPIILMTGVISVNLNLSSISLTGRFFLQILLTLMSLASFPPGNRKSYGFQIYYLDVLLSFELLRGYQISFLATTDWLSSPILSASSYFSYLSYQSCGSYSSYLCLIGDSSCYSSSLPTTLSSSSPFQLSAFYILGEQNLKQEKIQLVLCANYFITILKPPHLPI